VKVFLDILAVEIPDRYIPVLSHENLLVSTRKVLVVE
jgi:hypothetical protein